MIRFNKEKGFTIIEVLVATLIMAIVSLGLAMSSINSYSTLRRSMRHSVASHVALEAMEEFAAQDPTTFDATDGYNVSVTEGKYTFTRTATVVVNADDSRTVTISVESSELEFPIRSEFTNTFSLWSNT